MQTGKAITDKLMCPSFLYAFSITHLGAFGRKVGLLLAQEWRGADSYGEKKDLGVIGAVPRTMN